MAGFGWLTERFRLYFCFCQNYINNIEEEKKSQNHALKVWKLTEKMKASELSLCSRKHSGGGAAISWHSASKIIVSLKSYTGWQNLCWNTFVFRGFHGPFIVTYSEIPFSTDGSGIRYCTKTKYAGMSRELCMP